MLHTRLVFLFVSFLFLNLRKVVSFSMQTQITNAPRTLRKLPEKVLVGYATDCNEDVAKAVREGVNVVAWSFLDLRKLPDGSIVAETALDLDCIQQMISQLDFEGFNSTVHLISFGGWNGPHLDPDLTADDWYNSWKGKVGGIFHGIDWDLEGHNNLDNPTNSFSIECLDKMGCISRLAREDGYIIGMAPPQSYLDVDSPNFSRQVNLTEPGRPWHSEFHYFGANVYAYILAKYGDYIDFISIQFYESYSRAAMAYHYYGISKQEYLERYVEELVKKGHSYLVNFDEDPSLNYPSRQVSVPLSKLVFGFANGWALDSGDKAIFFEPGYIEVAYRNLCISGKAPRGFMFWVIGEEGKHGVFYARELNKILKSRGDVIQEV